MNEQQALARTCEAKNRRSQAAFFHRLVVAQVEDVNIFERRQNIVGVVGISDRCLAAFGQRLGVFPVKPAVEVVRASATDDQHPDWTGAATGISTTTGR